MADVAGMTLEIAERFLALSRRECKSRSVSASLQLVELQDGSWAVESPFYWAVYYHDGRGPIRAKPGHVLVYFRDIDQDPRVQGRNYPVRASDIKRLTKAQFYAYLKDPSRGMIVRDSVGPAEGDPFFLRAQEALSRQVGPLIEDNLHQAMRDELGEFFDFDGEVSVRL